MPPSIPPPLIFVSHAREDESPVRSELLQHLTALEKSGKIRVWIDLNYEAGAEWFPEMEEAFSDAAAAILLVSSLYLSREFIRNEELPALEEQRKTRKLPVLPLLLEECVWKEIPLISQAVVWPNEKRRLNELSVVDRQKTLVEFVGQAVRAATSEQGAFESGGSTFGRTDHPFVSIPIGRELERNETISLLRANRGVNLYGVPGQGKTELARYIGSGTPDQYPSGFYEIDLQYEKQIENLSGLIASSIGSTSATSSYEVLRNTRLLLLLDGFDQLLLNNDREKVGRSLSSLLSALGDGSRVIITSHQKIEKIGIVPKPVRPLTPEFSLTLFHKLSGGLYEDSDKAELADFVDRSLGGHPLSIKIVARYCSKVRIPLEDLRRLWREKWAEIAKTNPSFDDRPLFAAFEISYATLANVEQLWFVVLSLLPDGISVSSIKDIWPDEEASVYSALGSLSDRGFLEERGDQSLIRLIGPLYSYSSEKRLEAERNAIGGIGERLRQHASSIDEFLDQYVERFAPQPSDSDQRTKSQLVRVQFHNIHASLSRRLEPSTESSALAAASSVLHLYWAYHNNLGAANNPMVSPIDAVNYLRKAHDIFVANRRNDQAIRCQYYIGNILWLRGDSTARSYLSETANNDGATPEIICDSRRAFAHIEYKESSLTRAVELYEDVIEAAEKIDYVDCIQRCWVGLLDAYRKLEEYDIAIEKFNDGINPSLSHCQRSIRGNLLRAYAYILAQKGDAERAKNFYNDALKEFDGVSAFGQAHCRRGLGDVYLQMGFLDAAATEFDAAMVLYDEAHKNPSLGVGLVALGRGKLLAAKSHFNDAILEFRNTAALFDRNSLNEPYEFGVAHELLGDAHSSLGHRELALANYQIALTTFIRMEATKASSRLNNKIDAVSS